jgi:hypothetical protein
MDLLQKDVPSLAKIYEAKCFYDSQNNRIILYYKNHVTARTLVDVYNLPTTPPPNSSLYVIYDLQTGTFNVSTDPPTYTISNSKVYVTSPINAEYDMDKVIIYRISWYETDTDYILTQLNTFVRKQQADTITATHTFNPTQPGPAFQLGPNAQNQLIQYLNADTVDGFHASLTPSANTIKPLDDVGRFYTPVLKGSAFFDPPDFVMSNATEYFVGNVNISTPSWSPSGVWKLIFIVKSYFHNISAGVNNFINRIKTTSYVMDGAFWHWYATTIDGHGVADCFLIPELPSGITQRFDFYVVQAGGNANAVFEAMIVEWYLFPA